jgi:hypothetical protein
VITDDKCTINVLREGGTDGKISCRYKTVELHSHQSAVGGVDFVHDEGILEFNNEQSVATIEIKILPKAEEELKGEVNKAFAIQLTKSSIREVKIKTPMLVIELVKDA